MELNEWVEKGKPLNSIVCCDCLEGMKELPDGCVDLVVTSPPYDNLRDYKGYSFPFESIARELFRIIKQGGVIVWVVGDATINGSETGTSFKQALFFKEIGFNLHDTMIYQKNQYPPNCLSQLRYAQIFEYMFIFSKGKVVMFNPITRENKLAGQKKSSLPTAIVQRNGKIKRYGKNRSEYYHKKTIERNIWIYNTGGASGDDSTAHPAIFPEKLAKDHILSWSYEGGIVLDIFNGSGTTCKMATLEGRNYIGFEISEEYCKIAENRLKPLKEQNKLPLKDAE